MRHLDDAKTNNVPANLAWGMDDDNMNDFARNAWLRKIAREREFGAHPRRGIPRYLQPLERSQLVTLTQEHYRPSLTER